MTSKMKSFVFLFIQMGYFIYVQSYDQLVRPRVTVAESSSVGYKGIPSRTVDGDTTQSPYTYCMHTADRQREAWLKVDLGRVYNLKSVKIWYRNDNPPSNTKRLQGFSVRLSNKPTPVPSDTCYQDPGDKALPAVLERDCRGEAKYVWFYTDRNNGGDGVFLEICEVEIYGCPDKHFGEKCWKCDACGGHCDVMNGKCQCFHPGYQPPTCNIACEKGSFGSNCGDKCGHCHGNTSCHHVSGSCPGGHCKLGWKHTKERKCDQECDDGRYGLYCRNNCSGHCADGLPCRKTDGVCPRGCMDGWTGSYCNETCEKGFYGPSCTLDCGHCKGGNTCDHVSGTCPSEECEPGWQETSDRKCDQVCKKGSYGLNCKRNCGHCKGGVTCDQRNGACPSRDCEPGWKQTSDQKCNKVCEKGSYGLNCTLDCGHCKGGTPCHHVNGSCPSIECEPGWQQTTNRKCDQVCEKGSYGLNCTLDCGHCKGGTPCHHVNGSCPSIECEPGWQQTTNRKCDQVCEKGSYGLNCTRDCGHCKGGTPCHHVNGSCPSIECEPGWQQTGNRKCNQVCEKGSYGLNCTHDCGHCKGGTPCNHVNGACPSRECEPGWKQTSHRKCDQACEERSYGLNCRLVCGYCKGGTTCNHVNGSCPSRECEPGWKQTTDRKCNQDCDNGTFGFQCNFTCSQGCLSVCNKMSGTCNQCLTGYIGGFCNVSVSASEQETAMTAAVGGGVGGLIAIVIVLILLLVIITRRTQKKKSNEIEIVQNAQEKRESKAEANPEGNGDVQTNSEPCGNVQQKTLIKIANLGKIIRALAMEENKKFNEEFKGIPYGEQIHIPCDAAKLAHNMPKNRYKTTFPYDHSRVVLTVSPETDYINGNYIKDTKGQRGYIATQGPRKNTVQDFWAMIWQENIRVIVMVTNLTEGSTIKCEQYWPAYGEQMTSGSFSLQIVSQRISANYIQRDINITHRETNVVRTLNHMQYTAWPDHGTPSPVELLVFYRHVKQLTQMYPDSLLVVHCSAGIGRTGTFIGLDALYKQGLTDGMIDVVRYVNIMREDRMNMIQNVGQYIFLYNALNEIFQFNGRLLKKDQFIQEVTSQLMSNQAANASYFKKEYNELVSIRPTLGAEDTTEAKQNIHLNMTKTVLPADNRRTLLTSYVGGRGNYYNAVSISSYTQRDGLIAAQYPVEGAAIDLVRMLIDHDSSIVISVNQLSEIASTAEWFKTSAEKSAIAPYKTILGKSYRVSQNVKMTSVKMKHDKSSNWHNVNVFEVMNWKIKNPLPADTNVCVELMKEVDKLLKNKETIITVLSRDGATGCGVICAVYNAMQQLQLDDEVDMFTIVRQLQIRRPEMISSLNEYQFCCKVIANFFTEGSEAIYENAAGHAENPNTDESIYANTSV